MIINTLVFFLITFISFLSFIGYGKLANKFIFQSTENEINQFNFFFLGLIIIIPLSFLYNLTITNNTLFNFSFLLLGIFFYFFLPGSKDYKKIFLLTLLFFSGLLISKTHEDFSSYHFQHMREISNNYLLFGLANLDERYFYSSIYAYVQVLFKFNKLDLNLIHIPVFLIYLSFVGYCLIQIYNGNRSLLLSIVLFLFIVKFKRLSEFGYDYIGQFILLYVFFEYLFNTVISKENNTKLFLIYLTSVLIKISNIYFLPVIIVFFIYQRKFIELLYFKKALIVSLLFVLIFSFNSFLKTGCVNYLFKNSCFSSKIIDWNFDYEKIESSKKIIKNWSKGLYHQKKIQLSESEYNKNFNWVKNWLDVYAINKIGKFILIFLILNILIRYFLYEKEFKKKFNLHLLLGNILSILVWFLNFPQFRFGFASIIILLVLLSQKIIGESKIINKKNFFIFLILTLTYYNISNVSRIYKEFKRNDLYKYNNFPWYAKPVLNYELDKSKNFSFVRSSKNKNFWTTCFNAPMICANHSNPLEFRIKGRKLFIIDKK